ncbi:gamma-glutamyltransferase [Pseudomonas fragi]|uniref:Gamma-glutamyltransferase n=1 Tax=Pseudomonas fragi TaxID=296 RepID=A0A449ISK5_PSEFR|nr:gamma-glutamyltransferase [Pseudomonas fragi]
MTTSVEAAFGSHVMTQGFILNNQLTDFSFIPEENGKPVAQPHRAGQAPALFNGPDPGVRRKSGELVATIGSPGGSQIIEYVNKVGGWPAGLEAETPGRNQPAQLWQPQCGH